MFDKFQNMYDAAVDETVEAAMNEYRQGNRAKALKTAFKGGLVLGGIISMPAIAVSAAMALTAYKLSH